ncbi:hypothetical protein [Nostoc sp.]|uniref:hypothetical protein n=1 Tax=Nostoc sp. TaxID=1180 RepID=UPI002FF62273
MSLAEIAAIAQRSPQKSPLPATSSLKKRDRLSACCRLVQQDKQILNIFTQLLA